MSQKPSARQQEQLRFLEAAAPKIQRVQALIEQLAASPADESTLRRLIRLLEEMKAGASQLKMSGLSDAAGQMTIVARRGGGHQVKVRGLRDLLGALKLGYDGAMKKATRPEGEADAE